MANNLPFGDYIPTERDLFNLIGEQWPDKLRKDYIASKFNSAQLLQFINENTADIADIQLQLTVINGQITVINGQIVTLQSDLEIVADDLADHTADSTTHGASGDIVGNLNYAAPTVGGVVWLASAVANATASSVTVAAPSATAAPALYDQTQAQTVVTLANELKTDVTQLVADLNAAITQLNAMLASERTAKQRAT
jgi:hypothetical protein